MYKLKLETKISSFHDSNFEHVWLKSVIVVPGQIHDVATLRVAEEANLKSCGLKMGEIIKLWNALCSVDDVQMESIPYPQQVKGTRTTSNQNDSGLPETSFEEADEQPVCAYIR